MRTAVVFFPASQRDKLREIAKALAAGIESQGHRVDLIDGSRDVNSKLTIYEYIAVGVEIPGTFGSKVPGSVKEFLGESGIVSGKRSFAFVMKKPFGTSKALQSLMKTMESEGMFLKLSEILSSPEESREIGKRLIIR